MLALLFLDKNLAWVTDDNWYEYFHEDFYPSVPPIYVPVELKASIER
jgi:hypothetical protein